MDARRPLRYLTRARSWLEDAESLLAHGDPRRIEPFLDRIEDELWMARLSLRGDLR